MDRSELDEIRRLRRNAMRRERYAENKVVINEKRRQRNAENKDVINAKRRRKRTEKRNICGESSNSALKIATEAYKLPVGSFCSYCGAYKFYKETENFCCSKGRTVLAPTILPQLIVDLLTGKDKESKDFRNMIRTYNNHFAFTSIGIHCDENFQKRDHGIYTVRVCGSIHHRLDDLIPADSSRKMVGLQFYFYDAQNQAANRLRTLPRLDVNIVENLIRMFSGNPYSRFLQEASLLEEPEKYCIVIKSDPQVDQRTYNAPSSTEVAGIWIEDENGDSSVGLTDIRVYTKSGQSHRIKPFYSCYDPLQYVLMFPNGELGWHPNIKRSCITGESRDTKSPAELATPNIADCATFDEVLAKETPPLTFDIIDDNIETREQSSSSTSKRIMISCREYYVYKVQIRPGDRSYILKFGRLLQQYVIDNYVKLETMRLDYLRHHQKELRQEHYQGIIDSIDCGVEKGARIGSRVYLPATFIGGPRNYRNQYLNSMALVQEYGKPDLFLTMTCNPNWPEIKQHLGSGEEAQNRPDLLSRVFKAKLGVLYDIIMEGKVFGQPASVVHVIEFQKRGLPHAHILVILKSQFKYLSGEAYDRVVCAELPDRDKYPHLYSVVVAHMIHGPCGDLNKDCSCMRNGKCKFHYPKKYCQYTTHGEGSYPVYRRRKDGRVVNVRKHDMDNRSVVPYNPILLSMFDCHLNVEICCDIRAVKYLYKYVHKGHDKIKFRIAPDNEQDVVDEISAFQDARWISAVEATWRLFGFFMSSLYPSVIQLQVHLPNFHNVQFDPNSNMEDIIRSEKMKRTMLTEFFRMNLADPETRGLNLLYKEFPKFFVWETGTRTWKKRERGTKVGRLSTVSPVDNECYYLRTLLNNVRAPTSYEYLRDVGGVMQRSFQEAAYERGLLHNDDDAEKTMEEAAIYQMPIELRRLFATLLHYCNPADPKSLFDLFFDNMAEDFKNHQSETGLTDDDILRKVIEGINGTLQSLGRDVQQFHFVPAGFNILAEDNRNREINFENSIPVPVEHLHDVHKLNVEQKSAFDSLYGKALSNVGGAFFVDGPGGTGKSFLYKVLLAHIRSHKFVGIIVASSGIASSNFLGGRTAHSRFKIPIDADSTVKCQIKFQSPEADLIRSSRIIIWDEAPMTNKIVIQALNCLLQDLCENKNIFGGKLVVFGGDFRQVLPVVRGGDKMELIEASLVSSTLWPEFTKLQLTDNMRSREDPGFTEFLMRIGNGEEPVNDLGQVLIPKPMIIPFVTLEESLDQLISFVFPNMDLFEEDPFEMMQRTILCPKNEFVDDINSRLIQQLSGEEVKYVSDDKANNFQDQGDYVDYLNSLEPKGLPPHILTLKVNSPIMLLRNVNPGEGLCNGTRMICKQLHHHVIGAQIASGQFKGKHVWIPRIPMSPNRSDNKYMIPFTRKQFPVRLCFAMTINKAQGQTLDCVGIYLKQPVFSHGQLYVALSRAKNGKSIRILIVPPTCNDIGTECTSNVVYEEVLKKAKLV